MSAPIDLPVSSRVRYASKEECYLGILIDLDLIELTTRKQ